LERTCVGSCRISQARRTQFTLPAWQALCGAGDIRSRPQPRSGGAERDSLEGMASVWPHGDKQVLMPEILIAHWGHSWRQALLPGDAPFDAAFSRAAARIAGYGVCWVIIYADHPPVGVGSAA